jgi:flagellar biosynthetic protein FliP
MPRPHPFRLLVTAFAVAALALVGTLVLGVGQAFAQTAPAEPPAQTAGVETPVLATMTDTATTPGAAPGTASNKASISIELPGGTQKGEANQGLIVIVLVTLIAVAPALLMMLTSFTRIVIVLSLTRNALGLQAIPPNQVIVGLALFLSFFVMSPTLSTVNKVAVQPLLHGEKTQQEAYDSAVKPIRAFMLKQTGKPEMAMFVSAATGKKPTKPENVSMAALVPAFILSELKTAFIIGFIIFIPFLVIDIVVSSSLMSMGMMMLPPVIVSLPFKLLLFVMVDGWGLVVKSLLTSFR